MFLIQWLQFILLVRRLKNAVQKEIARIPDFKHGAIQFLFVPKCKKADRMMFAIGRDCERKFIFPSRDGYGHTRPSGFRDSEESECDCSGYAALKIQGAAFALKNGYGSKSQDMPDADITWGRENDPGAICFLVFKKARLFMRVYVAVSGASGQEDQKCAEAAGPILSRWAKWRGMYVM